MQIYIGDLVTWKSAAGTINGEIVDINIGPSATTAKTGKLQVWVTVHQLNGKRVTICGSNDYLAMLKFKVLERAAYAA